MKVLVVDDDLESVRPAIGALRGNGFDCEHTGFEGVERRLREYAPDMVVLDLMVAGRDEIGRSGAESCDMVWSIHFCPVVVHSANPDLLDVDHPLVVRVRKGRDSDEEVVRWADMLRPYAESVLNLRQATEAVLRETLRDMTRRVLDNVNAGQAAEDARAIEYMGGRRVSAHLENFMMERDRLVAESIYLVPPIDDQIRMGDILRRTEAPAEDAVSFLMVLTPSCDLVVGQGRTRKVDNVLCARCESLTLETLGMQGTKKKQSVAGKLRAGLDGKIALPRLASLIPHMVADLRALELVPFEQIDPTGESSHPFTRVASVDSPFREQLAWQYLGTGCRLGVPDRDMEAWAEELIPPQDDDQRQAG